MDIEKDKRDVALLDLAIAGWKRRYRRFKRKTIKWYTQFDSTPCPLCAEIDFLVSLRNEIAERIENASKI